MRMWALAILLVFLGIAFCVGLGFYSKSENGKPNGSKPMFCLIPPTPTPPIRITVIETIRNSATVLVYITETAEDLWLQAKAEGKSLLLSCGDFKKRLTFECEIIISHSEYINHAREAGPALILELLFNVDNL